MADPSLTLTFVALESQSTGTRDFGDPLTTNVCALNLPANISEKALGDFFCQWGDIGTVKIMWPRGEESTGGAGGGITAYRNTKSSGLIGFVCYMKREDAEYAMKEADGISWGGCTLATSWGKAMPRPARAFYGEPAQLREWLMWHAELILAMRLSCSDATFLQATTTRPRTVKRKPALSITLWQTSSLKVIVTIITRSTIKECQCASSRETAISTNGIIQRHHL